MTDTAKTRHIAIRDTVHLISGALRRRPVGASRLRKHSKAELACLHAALGWNQNQNILGFGVGQKVTGGKVGAPRSCLIVFVANKLAKSRIAKKELVPGSLSIPNLDRKVQTDVVEIGGIPQFQTGPILNPACDAANFTMAHGTVTAIVRPMNGPPSPLMLSCCHGFAPLGTPGPQIESPPDLSALTFTNLVAQLGPFEPLQPGGNIVNRMDAALAIPIPARVGGLSNTIPGAGPIATASNLRSGEFAQNGIRTFLGAGAMTPRMTGQLMAENVSSVFADARGRVFLFQDLVAYNPAPITQSGDSGMPILRRIPGGFELLGMHIGISAIAGTATKAAFFVPISIVLGRFAVALL